MVPNGTAYDSFPSFADSGTRVQPSPASKYSQGFLPGETYPAEWQNWFMHGATAGISRLNADTLSIKKEINSVLAEKGIANNADSYTQLLQAFNMFKAEAILAAHPVGSLYWTSSDENPAVTFGGGTWTQIKDKFVWAKGDSDTVNATGGAKTVTITSANLPTHTHSFEHTHEYTPSGKVASTSGGTDNKTGGMSAHSTGWFDGFKPDGGTSSDSFPAFVDDSTFTKGTGNTTPMCRNNSYSTATRVNMNIAHTHNVYFTGSQGTTTSQSTSTTGDGGFANSAVDKMPPYIVKYCWERTA